MSKWYILNRDGEPVPSSGRAWAKWYEGSLRARVVGCDHLAMTEFRGLDQQSDPEGPPLLYETITARGEQFLYSTREEALRGHAAAVAGSHA